LWPGANRRKQEHRRHQGRRTYMSVCLTGHILCSYALTRKQSIAVVIILVFVGICPSLAWQDRRSRPFSQSTGRNKPSVYVLGLQDGRRYVGSTSNPDQRIMDHVNGRGAAVTAESGVAKVLSINRCRSMAAAKRAETTVYQRMRDYHGSDVVRACAYVCVCVHVCLSCRGVNVCMPPTLFRLYT